MVVFAVVGAVAAFAAERNFPFDQELLLDTAPLRGSKRVPGIEVLSNGWETIDLWCASARGRVRVEGPTISIVPHNMAPAYNVASAPCPPDRMRRDADMLSALTRSPPGGAKATRCC